MVLLGWAGLAAPMPHVVTLGKWTSVKWQAGDDEGKPGSGFGVRRRKRRRRVDGITSLGGLLSRAARNDGQNEMLAAARLQP